MIVTKLHYYRIEFIVLNIHYGTSYTLKYRIINIYMKIQLNQIRHKPFKNNNDNSKTNTTGTTALKWLAQVPI